MSKSTDQIAAELRKKPKLERLRVMPNDCSTRRDEIRARLVELSRSSAPGLIAAGAARAGARTVEDHAKLDDEETRLGLELDVLGDLERTIFSQIVLVADEQARAAAPGARRDLPRSAARIRAALAELDAAIAALGTALEPLAAVAGFTNEPFPLDDAACAELIELRNLAWKVRNVPVLLGEPAAEFPRARAAFFETVGEHGNARIRPRQPPHFVWLPDVGQAVYR